MTDGSLVSELSVFSRFFTYFILEYLSEKTKL